MNPTLEQLIRLALEFLTETEQAHDALIMHHGWLAGQTGDGRFKVTATACELTSGGYALLIFEVADPKPLGVGIENPITRREQGAILELVGHVSQRPVRDLWNGYGCNSLSVVAGVACRRGVLNAIANYHAGCPEHGGSVFCTCGWFARGHEKMRYPKLEAI